MFSSNLIASGVEDIFTFLNSKEKNCRDYEELIVHSCASSTSFNIICSVSNALTQVVSTTYALSLGPKVCIESLHKSLRKSYLAKASQCSFKLVRNFKELHDRSILWDATYTNAWNYVEKYFISNPPINFAQIFRKTGDENWVDLCIKEAENLVITKLIFGKNLLTYVIPIYRKLVQKKVFFTINKVKGLESAHRALVKNLKGCKLKSLNRWIDSISKSFERILF